MKNNTRKKHRYQYTTKMPDHTPTNLSPRYLLPTMMDFAASAVEINR